MCSAVPCWSVLYSIVQNPGMRRPPRTPSSPSRRTSLTSTTCSATSPHIPQVVHTAQLRVHIVKFILIYELCRVLLQTAQFRVYTEQFRVYTVQFIVHTAQCTLYSLQCTLHTTYCTLHTPTHYYNTSKYTNWPPPAGPSRGSSKPASRETSPNR